MMINEYALAISLILVAQIYKKNVVLTDTTQSAILEFHHQCSKTKFTKNVDQ